MIVVVETDFPSTFLPWPVHGFVPSDRASASCEKWTGASIQWNSAQILPCFFWDRVHDAELHFLVEMPELAHLC